MLEKNYLTNRSNRFEGKKASVYKVICLLFFAMAFSFTTFASHYRYGNISWSRADDVTRTVNITVNQAWRWSAFGNPAIGTTVTTETLNLGDGNTLSVVLTVTSVDAANDAFFGSFTTSYTYSGTGTNFTLSYGSCCRVSTLANNNDGNYGSSTLVNLTSGNTGSPISTMQPTINIQQGQAAATFNVTGYDPDGTALTFALATGADVALGGTFTQPAGFSINSSTGLCTFNTVGLSLNSLHNAAVTLTDASGAKVCVDFVIKIVGNSTAPSFSYGPTPANNGTLTAIVGLPLTFTLQATDIDAGNTVSISGVGLPSGMTFSPTLPASGTQTVTTTASWTPSAIGNYALNFTATDNNGVQTITILNINAITSLINYIAPTPNSGSIVIVEPGSIYAATINAVGATGNNVQFSSTTLPLGAVASPTIPTALDDTATTSITWTPALANFGFNPVSIMATDAVGNTFARNFSILVNTLPSFTSSDAPIALTVGNSFSHTVTIADPDVPFGDAIDILVHGTLPSWLTFTVAPDGASAVLSGTPPTCMLDPIEIELVAEDLHHHSYTTHVEQHLTLNVSLTAPSSTSASSPTFAPLAAIGTLTLNAVSVGNTINWYTVASGGTPVGTSTSGVNFTPSLSTVTTYYAESSNTYTFNQVYSIPLSQITGLNNSCGGNASRYGNGFTLNFTDVLNPSTTITNITVEISKSVDCDGSSHSTSLNGIAQSATVPRDYYCDCSGASFLSTFTVNPSDYIKGGSNNINVSGNTFGLVPSSSLGNQYARVTVTATAACASATRTPVSVLGGYIFIGPGTDFNDANNWAGMSIPPSNDPNITMFIDGAAITILPADFQGKIINYGTLKTNAVIGRLENNGVLSPGL